MQWLRSLVASAVFVLCTASAHAAGVPALTGRVNDYANVFTDEEEKMLDGKLAKIETYDKHPQVVLLTVDTIGDQDIADYALNVGRAWGIGQKDEDNGVIILLAKTERMLRIEVGYGLEGAVPDAKAFAIIKHVIGPLVPEGKEQWAKGFGAGIDSLDTLIRGESTGDEAIDNAVAIAEREATQQLFLIVGGLFAAILGYVHWTLSGLVGAGAGVGLSLVLAVALWQIPLYLIAGCLIGFFAHIMLRAKMEGGASIGGGSSGGGFSGGGGSFGGGGASGRI